MTKKKNDGVWERKVKKEKQKRNGEIKQKNKKSENDGGEEEE
jgi:hypothetical protein